MNSRLLVVCLLASLELELALLLLLLLMIDLALEDYDVRRDC